MAGSTAASIVGCSLRTLQGQLVAQDCVPFVFRNKNKSSSRHAAGGKTRYTRDGTSCHIDCTLQTQFETSTPTRFSLQRDDEGVSDAVNTATETNQCCSKEREDKN